MKWIVLSRIPSQSEEPWMMEDIIEADGYTFDEGGYFVSFYTGDDTKKNERYVAVFNRDLFIKAIKAAE